MQPSRSVIRNTLADGISVLLVGVLKRTPAKASSTRYGAGGDGVPLMREVVHGGLVADAESAAISWGVGHPVTNRLASSRIAARRVDAGIMEACIIRICMARGSDASKRAWSQRGDTWMRRPEFISQPCRALQRPVGIESVAQPWAGELPG